MPTTVPIAVFNIARTEVDRAEVEKWLEFLGVEDFAIPDDGAVTNPALLVALASKRCYKSFEVNEKLNPNIAKVRKDYAEYLDNILKSGHGSVMEHAVYTFAIENVSRVFTGEMNRHRAGWAISEGSMRFIRYKDIPYWLPDSIKGPDVLNTVPGTEDEEADEIIVDMYNTGDQDGVHKAERLAASVKGMMNDLSNEQQLDLRKELTRAVFQHAFGDAEQWYGILQALWSMNETDHNFAYKKKVTSMMRRIIGMGVATGGVWTGNIRALRHVITMRASEAAEEEILHVFTRVAKLMVKKEPLLFGDFEETPDGFWVPKYNKV